MIIAPRMWTIWGTAYRHRYNPIRLFRFWLALLACHRHGHRWNARGDDRRGCTRCWLWESQEDSP